MRRFCATNAGTTTQEYFSCPSTLVNIELILYFLDRVENIGAKNGRRRIKKPDTRHIIRTFERQFLRQKGINAIRRIGIRINKIRNRLTVISIDRPHQECQFVQRLNQSFSN